MLIRRSSMYALHAVAILAARPGVYHSSEEIRELSGIPGNYLAKILGHLRRAGIVEGRKGWGGGFRVPEEALSRPIRDILDVVEGDAMEAVDGCLFGFPSCDEEHPCPLHRYWEEIGKVYRRMLDETTIGDLGRFQPRQP